MQNQEKIYIGSGKEIVTKNGQMIKIYFSKKDLWKMASCVNDKGGISLVLSQRREPDQYNNTHYLTVDTWKPNKQAPENWGDLASNEVPF